MEYKDCCSRDMYDNSKEALARIMCEYGPDVLLGSRMKNLFNDFAPAVKKSRKNVVFFVIESGAAEILKRNIGAGAGEQEAAFRQAVQKVLEECPIERGEVENVMLEFTAALGWKVSVQMQNQQRQPVQQGRPASVRTQAAPQSLQTLSDAPGVFVQPPAGGLTPGQRNVSFGRYLWRVLDVQDGRALLLAEEVLEKRRYHSSNSRVTWEECELRGYLNEVFFWDFSSQERSRIAQSENITAANPWYKTPGGRNTTDKVFLLSIEEVVKYFGDRGNLKTGGKGVINGGDNGARAAKYRGSWAWWWLRSPGGSPRDAAYVGIAGDLDMAGDNVGLEYGGIRPALWLNGSPA